MANTTNFGWETPDDTDLVKDGAAAMRTLGNSIDTSFVDLKGGTTGQVLAKASNTDLDFTWTNGGDITAVTAGTGLSGGGSSGDVTLTNTVATAFDAKGDLVVGTGADTFSKLTVGTNGQYLSADSAEATGLKWVPAPTAGSSWSLVNTGGTALTGAQEITVSGITGADKLFIAVNNGSSANASSYIVVKINGDTDPNYNMWGSRITWPTTYDKTQGTGYPNLNDSSFLVSRISTAAASQTTFGCVIYGGNSSGQKFAQITSGANASTGADSEQYSLFGTWNNSATISSISVRSLTGNWDNGTLWVYKSA